jgi:hypothetical protein
LTVDAAPDRPCGVTARPVGYANRSFSVRSRAERRSPALWLALLWSAEKLLDVDRVVWCEHPLKLPQPIGGYDASLAKPLRHWELEQPANG